MNSITFDVPGKPIPKARARIGKGRAWTPTRTKKYEKKISDAAFIKRVMSKHKMLKGRIGIDMKIWNDMISVMVYEIDNRKIKRVADISNILKSVEDALNGILYVDDIQICEITVKDMT